MGSYMTVVVPLENWDAFRIELQALLIKHQGKPWSSGDKLEDVHKTDEVDVQRVPEERPQVRSR